MIHQKLDLVAVEKVCQKALIALRAGLLDQYNLAAIELVELVRVKNRNHWWELWKPRYRWPQLESAMNIKVEPGSSLPTRGRVTKVTSPPEYDPTKKVKGGRVTKTMPRQLKKIKEGQESNE